MLERITGIYSAENKKTTIDIDLMLDYTRVLYADLLAWKANLSPSDMTDQSKEPQSAGSHSGSGSETSSKDKDAGNNPDTQQDISGEQQSGWEIQDKPDNAWEEKMEQEDKEKGAVIANEFPAYSAKQETSVAEEKQKATPSNKDQKEETVKILSEDRSGISFEPPHASDPEPELIRKTLEEDAPGINPPVHEMSTGQQQKPPDHTRIFQAAQSVNNIKDIRKHIGINDKYLFLNELFNNNKTGYEEALDTINNMERAHAMNWIKTTLAVRNKWFEDDETVKSFYDVVEKHFASR